jgi:hypothetical protein
MLCLASVFCIAVSRVFLKKEKREQMSSASRDVNQTRDHLISIDSRFRKSVVEPPTDFLYSFEHSYKNVIAARVASVEIPIGFYAFSRVKKNTMFRVDARDYLGNLQTVTITIPDGDYTPACLIQHIQEEFNRIRDEYGLFFRISLNPNNRRVTISHDGSAPPPSPPGPAFKPAAFGLTFVLVGLENRSYDFGLGYALGFVNHFYEVTTPEITGESLINTNGDNYFLLAIDDFHTVEHKTHDSFIQVLAKILVKRHGSADIIFDDGYTVLSNDIVFPRPIDMKQVRIRLLDCYGVPIDLHHMNWSVSLEITEVMNVELYDRHRLAIWKEEEPRISSRVTGAGVPIALPGRSFN